MWSMFSDGIFLQLVKEISCTSVMELLFLWRCNLFWFMGIVFLFAVISGVLENSRKRDEAQKIMQERKKGLLIIKS